MGFEFLELAVQEAQAVFHNRAVHRILIAVYIPQSLASVQNPLTEFLDSVNIGLVEFLHLGRTWGDKYNLVPSVGLLFLGLLFGPGGKPPACPATIFFQVVLRDVVVILLPGRGFVIAVEHVGDVDNFHQFLAQLLELNIVGGAHFADLVVIHIDHPDLIPLIR